MKLSDLIRELQEVQETNGDIEVRYMNAPITWIRPEPMKNWGEDWIRIE